MASRKRIPREKRMAYYDGVNDAIELCFSEVRAAKDREEAESRLAYLLGLVKEAKIESLKRMLGVLS